MVGICRACIVSSEEYHERPMYFKKFHGPFHTRENGLLSMGIVSLDELTLLLLHAYNEYVCRTRRASKYYSSYTYSLEMP
jgi:hypothetical protein